MNDKNWRGQERHLADEWDHWRYTQKEFDEIKEIVDAVADVDRDKLMAFAEIVARHAAAEEADANAGADI